MDEYITTQKNVGHSPRKLRLVADMVRKTTPEKALELLKFTNRAGAFDLAKAIKTAIANAGNNSKQGLAFKKIEINEGLKMKRYRVGTAGRGRGRPYKKRLSHIKIILVKQEINTQDVKPKVVEKKEGVKQ